jgi:hypothetical protein
MSNLGPERSGGIYNQPVEYTPRTERRELERTTIERQEVTPGSQSETQTPALPPPVLPQVTPVPAPSPQTTSTQDAPLIANDDDLIEKEWVDKAKQIIASTRDDPFRREEEIGRLQADYLKKRYGKDLHVVED